MELDWSNKQENGPIGGVRPIKRFGSIKFRLLYFDWPVNTGPN